MRFLVDLYRVLIIGALALLLFGASFLLSLVAFGAIWESQYPLPLIIGGLALVAINLGFVVITMSMHDRLADIAFHAKRMADAASEPPILEEMQ